MYLDYSKLAFDKNGTPETPTLVLKTMHEETIGVIPGVYNLKLSVKFAEPSEMTFDVPAILDGEKNWIYDELVGYKVIYTEHYGIYVVMNPTTSADGISDVKHVQCYSLEKVLDTKKFFLEDGDDGSLLDLQVAVTDACRNFDSDSEEYDKHNAGDDPAEIYQIREFRQGDKMSRVHWKMTARLDQMMIKELSRPISDSVGIFLDLRYQTIEEIQSVYDLCYSLSAALCFNECHHRMIWYSQDGGGAFEEHLIKGMDDITAVMSKLLVSAKRTDKLYWEEYKSSRSTPLYRMIAISCMDTNKDEQLGDFLSSDGTRKSILTINEIHELIEI